MWIELKESELIKTKDENIYLQRDNLKLLKQRNVFCLIAKRLYTNITQLHLDCEIGQKIHRMILPFLEFKEDEIDAEAYNCESVISSEDVNPTYMYGLDKIESFIKSKDHKNMLKNLLDENDKLKLRTETIQKFDSLNANLSSENKIDVENASELNEDDNMSEISVEDTVDCSEFVKSEPENHKNLISENSVEFARLSQQKSPILAEKAVVYQKVRTTPNQVYKVTGVTEHQTAELTAIVNEDNADGCDEFFWSAPIDNADETVGLSERTSWKSKGRYVPEPLNKPDNFDVPSTSGTKDIPQEKGIPAKEVTTSSETSSVQSEPAIEKPKPKANIHHQPKQMRNQKRQRNQRYRKNLSERKQFWQSQNA